MTFSQLLQDCPSVMNTLGSTSDCCLFPGGPTQNVDLVNGILICKHSDNRYGKIDSVWQILRNRILAVIGLSEYLDRLNLLMFWRPESIATMPAGVRAEKHVLETAPSEQISDVG